MRIRLAARVMFIASAAAGCKFAELPPVASDASVDAAGDGGSDAVVDAPACEASTTTCSNSTLIECDAAGVATVTPCGFDCASTGDRCRDLSPSNSLATYLDQARSAGALVLTGNATIDTSAEEVRNGDGSLVTVLSARVVASPVDMFVVSVSSLDVANVTVRGSRPLAIMVDGDATVRGLLSVSAARDVPGAGGLAGFHPFCTAQQGTQASNGTAGGGGGGHGTAGGRGGNGGGGIGGSAGAMNGDSSNAPLRGGCPGALSFGAIASDPQTERPGAPGGALQLSARGRVRLEAGSALAANGGGAKGWTGPFQSCAAGTPPDCHQGSGGGAGGALLIEASSLEVADSVILVANGGAGHCGYAGQAPDGTLSQVPAAGTVCTGSIGNGGAGASVVTDAVNGSSGTSYGGGGGGGVGRIRVNLPAGVSFSPGSATVSPTPSVGVTATR